MTAHTTRAEAPLGGSKPTAPAATLPIDDHQREDDLSQTMPVDDLAHAAWSVVAAAMSAATHVCRALNLIVIPDSVVIGEYLTL